MLVMLHTEPSAHGIAKVFVFEKSVIEIKAIKNSINFFMIFIFFVDAKMALLKNLQAQQLVKTHF